MSQTYFTMKPLFKKQTTLWAALVQRPVIAWPCSAGHLRPMRWLNRFRGQEGGAAAVFPGWGTKVGGLWQESHQPVISAQTTPDLLLLGHTSKVFFPASVQNL